MIGICTCLCILNAVQQCLQNYLTCISTKAILFIPWYEEIKNSVAPIHIQSTKTCIFSKLSTFNINWVMEQVCSTSISERENLCKFWPRHLHESQSTPKKQPFTTLIMGTWPTSIWRSNDDHDNKCNKELDSLHIL